MNIVFEQNELSRLLVRVAALGRPLSNELVEQVTVIMKEQLEIAAHYKFAIIERPVVGIVNVLLAPDYAHATGMADASLNSPHIEADVANMGTELIGHLRAHYANIVVKH